LAPKHPDALSNAGLFYSISGDYERAKKLYKQAIEIVPDHAIAHLNLCSLDYQEGDPLQALNRSYILTTKFSEKFEAWLARGQLLLATGQMDEAYKVSVEMVNRFPDDPVAFDFQGRVLLHRGEFYEVERISRMMIAEFDENPRGYNLLAAVLLRLNQMKEVFSTQEQGLEKAPEDLETIWCAVQVAEKTDNSEAAEEWKSRLDEINLDLFIETAPIGQRCDKLFWLKDGIGLHSDTKPEK